MYNKIYKIFIPILITIIYFLSNNILHAANILNNLELVENNNNLNIIITLKHKTDYKLFKLDNPDRLVIDFKKTKFIDRKYNIKNDYISNFRYGMKDSNNLRLVFDLYRNVKLKSYTKIINDKFQIIISIKHNKYIYNIERNSKIDIAPKKEKKLIVIDAGHGGEDPGTIGRYTNIYEKNITLKYAKTLSVFLEKTNLYKVILTRNKDTYLSLTNRVAKAKESNADLFISLHADSHIDEKMRGMTIYTLSESSEDKIYKKENVISINQENNDIKYILEDLSDRLNRNIAIEFASSIVNEIGKEVSVIKNSHRFAPFKVLKNEEVPAVLIELGYLSNKSEEKLLVDDKYRTKIINALVKAINNHFNK